MSPDVDGSARTGKVSRRALQVGGALLAVAAAVVLLTGLSSRRSQAADLRERADAQSVPTVSVIAPGRAASGASATLELPGRIEAHARAPLYARVSGYLKSWKTDIGANVKAGQLLAEIETPDLDQQLVQAQAELASAKSNAALAASTSKRWQSLLDTHSVSRQEADEKAGDLANKQSLVNGLQANVERYQALKRFARIVAPFDGVVTARNTDVGALIGVGGTPGSELFVVSDTRKLRVYVNVPQNHVSAVRVGTKARLSVPEHPGRVYTATVQSLSQAIVTGSGSMLVQLAADNGAGELLPGGFANLRFELPQAAGVLSVPPSALMFDKSGLRVATVTPDDKVAWKPVKVARDLGASIELSSGLAAGDRVIESPPDGIAEGDPVRVAATEVSIAKPVASTGVPAGKEQARGNSRN
jgi:RND family efflux transporter MFP subunit